ncbi:hypothetical protein [Zobellia uliginosa]|uniref:hypothetical protein n=1 Tax=Zobellia uliginosa TaxID=143224 RepID=UPI0026E1D115|nr:hypothetical protein [Zobellia uliginosa]MDO6518604.1 hypothetical protein [Zobellia uliginosa]
MKIKGILLIILAVVVIYSYTKNQKRQEAQDTLQEIKNERIKFRKTENTKNYLSNDEIAYAAQKFIEKSLKAPATAKFPALFKSSVTKKSSDTYYVSSYVDSENDFGAIIRSNYVVVLKQKSDGKITLIDLNISK